jgi:hypothetical protein
VVRPSMAARASSAAATVSWTRVCVPAGAWFISTKRQLRGHWARNDGRGQCCGAAVAGPCGPRRSVQFPKAASSAAAPSLRIYQQWTEGGRTSPASRTRALHPIARREPPGDGSSCLSKARATGERGPAPNVVVEMSAVCGAGCAKPNSCARPDCSPSRRRRRMKVTGLPSIVKSVEQRRGRLGVNPNELRAKGKQQPPVQ